MKNKILYHMKISGSMKIARRYFVINGFDGAITILGVILGMYLMGIMDHRIVLGTGLSAAIAIGVSGVSGAYLSEKAEKRSELNELEGAMLKRLDKSVLGDASKTVPWIIGFVDGISPFMISCIILFPFILGTLLPIRKLYLTSIIICFAVLFILGVIMGAISNENKLFYGIKTLVTGGITALLIFFIEFAL